MVKSQWSPYFVKISTDEFSTEKKTSAPHRELNTFRSMGIFLSDPLPVNDPSGNGSKDVKGEGFNCYVEEKRPEFMS
jgi:hypothetical protein